MAPHHVEVDQVGEQEPGFQFAQVTYTGGESGGVVGRVIVHAHAALGEDLTDLADADHGQPFRAQEIEVRGSQRRQREVAPPRRAPERARVARERSCDDATDGVRAAQDLARGLTPVIQLRHRHDVLVTSDLEHGIR